MEEYVDKKMANIGGLLDLFNKIELRYVLMRAYEAGYLEGYEIGVEEVMSK